MLKRIKGQMGKTDRFIDILFQPGIQIFSCHLFNDISENHIIHIGIDRFRSRFIVQRSLTDHRNRICTGCLSDFIPGKQRIIGIVFFGHIFPVQFRSTVFRICREPALMAEQIPNRQLCLPGFDRIQIRKHTQILNCTVGIDGYLNCFTHKFLSEKIRYLCVNVDLPIRHKFLKRIVCREHLGNRGKVIQRVGRDLRTVGTG